MQGPELQESFVVRIGQNSYTIKILTPGQVVDIETLKSQLTSGQYGNMTQSSTIQTGAALDYVDAVSTFTTLIPSLRESLNVKSLFDISLIQMEELVKEYRKFLLWWMGWIKHMRSLSSTAEVEDKKS